MEQTNQNIIKAIANHDLNDSRLFGLFAADYLFRKGERGLLFKDCHFVMLLEGNKDASKELRLITELMSCLRCMENEHVIYIQSGDCKIEECLFYQGCTDMKWTAASQNYNLGNGWTLQEKDGFYLLKEDKSTVSLSQNVNVDFLSEEIEHYFFGRILPTTTLQNFISHDFLSDNDFNNRQAIRTSRFSIGIAIGIACFSPIATLLLTNKCGETTITPTQYKQMMETIKEQNKPNDTERAIVEKLSEIKTIIQDNGQDSIKLIQGQR